MGNERKNSFKNFYSLLKNYTAFTYMSEYKNLKLGLHNITVYHTPR